MAYDFLIVDDSKLARAFTKKALTLSGVDVGEILQAANGREALQILEKNWVDLVFADINMPEMNGMELVARMKQHDIWSHIPVVMVSTEKSETRIEEMLAFGVKRYISKPFTPENLRDVVDDLIRNQPGGE